MSSRSIGKLIAINSKNIIAEMYDSLGNYISTLDGIYFVGEVGSYISIYNLDRTIIGEIIAVEERPKIIAEKFNKPNSSRLLYINLIGEIVSEHFNFGVSKMPLIFSEINIISEKDLQIMLETTDEEETVINNYTRLKSLKIGTSVIFSDYAVKVNIDKFFGFHFAVLGNTGSGKSNTIALILQNIFSKTSYSAIGAKFIIIDSNGEYNQAFSNITNINPNIKVKNFIANDITTNDTSSSNIDFFQLPIWALTADDWAILLHATEKTQLPILKRAITIANYFFACDDNVLNFKNHILATTIKNILNTPDSSPSKTDKIITVLSQFFTDDIYLEKQINHTLTIKKAIETNYGSMEAPTEIFQFLNKFILDEEDLEFKPSSPVLYDLKEFFNAVQFAILYEGYISSSKIQEYTAPLITRLQAFKDGVQGSILTKTSFKTIDEYVDSLLGKQQIVNIDISSLDDLTAETVTKVLAKMLLDYQKKQKPKADKPINFIIEEAHRFVRNEFNYGALGYNIFERISKEGRKFGLLLGISSQRPSELSKTVISQCSNFVIHRLQNPDDLQYISKMIPYVNQGIIDRITYLQTGTALVFGSAINLPTLTKFEQANPTTDSNNAKISEKWYQPIINIDEFL